MREAFESSLPSFSIAHSPRALGIFISYFSYPFSILFAALPVFLVILCVGCYICVHFSSSATGYSFTCLVRSCGTECNIIIVRAHLNPLKCTKYHSTIIRSMCLCLCLCATHRHNKSKLFSCCCNMIIVVRATSK